MGKWDPAHDYYAELELSPEASTEEIKKRYRKLGTFISHIHVKLLHIFDLVAPSTH